MPKTFSRYWDFSLPSAIVHPTTVSKANTFLQLVLIGGTLAVPVLAAGPLSTLTDLSRAQMDSYMVYYQYLVAATTIWSGASYAFLRNAVEIIGHDEALKARQGQRGRMIIGVTFGGVLAASALLAANDGTD